MAPKIFLARNDLKFPRPEFPEQILLQGIRILRNQGIADQADVVVPVRRGLYGAVDASSQVETCEHQFVDTVPNENAVQPRIAESIPLVLIDDVF